MPDRIIVTGAAGFIGRNIVEALNGRGYTDLILVDDLGTDDKWRNLRGLKFEQLLGIDDLWDFLDSQAADTVTGVVHMGACSATTERDADYLAANNYRYSQRLAEWCLAHDARLVYASSAATYGDGDQGYSDSDSVTPRLTPLNMYGFSKHLFDLWALNHGHLDKIVGLKFFNVYGPYEEHKGDMRSLVSKAYVEVRDTGKMRLFKSYRDEYADGEQKRDFIYVHDAVNVVLHFLLDSNASGLFNCGTSRATTWLELAGALFNVLGIPPQIEFIEMPESIRDRYQYFTEADGAKLRAAGYRESFRDVNEGVRDYVETYLRKELG
ncbi:MAG: ADP-glyceromanno-heptose 6-epimerase [Propionicimonas sp.]